MNYRLEHVAIYCKNLSAAIQFYQKFFGGQPTAVRKGDAGSAFCFMRIGGAPAMQLMGSATAVGADH
jgi:catechol 2,3-dioxygenase-like lactoylglutathione lyase family enzyme